MVFGVEKSSLILYPDFSTYLTRRMSLMVSNNVVAQERTCTLVTLPQLGKQDVELDLI